MYWLRVRDKRTLKWCFNFLFNSHLVVYGGNNLLNCSILNLRYLPTSTFLLFYVFFLSFLSLNKTSKLFWIYFIYACVLASVCKVNDRGIHLLDNIRRKLITVNCSVSLAGWESVSNSQIEVLETAVFLTMR